MTLRTKHTAPRWFFFSSRTRVFCAEVHERAHGLFRSDAATKRSRL